MIREMENQLLRRDELEPSVYLAHRKESII
jgi:hypothetical protein